MSSISVVIPTYNNGHFIAETLESVLTQSLAPCEVIIVDDGSTDETQKVLGPYRGHIRYHFQENKGLAVARNVGLELASGKYVTFLDADDVWNPQNLAIKAKVLSSHPEVGGVFSEFEIFDERGVVFPRGTKALFPFFKRTGKDFPDIFQRSERIHLPPDEEIPVYSGLVFESLFFGNFILPSSMVFNRSASEEVGRFKSHMRTQQDYEYWLRYSKRYPFAYVDKVLVRYRRHPQQLTDQSRMEQIFSAVLEIIDSYEEEFRGESRSRIFRRRKAELVASLAKVHIRKGEGERARSLLHDSVRLNPIDFSQYLSYLASYLPSSLIQRIRRIL